MKKRKELPEDAWIRGREAGYEAGVENERKLCLVFLEDCAKSFDVHQNPDSARLLRLIAHKIESLDHVTSPLTAKKRVT